MSKREDASFQSIAREGLETESPGLEISRGLEYPFDDSNNFDQDINFGKMDLAAIGSETVRGFSLADDISELPEVIDDISRVRGYLEEEGYENVYYHGFVNDERILELKEVGEELAPIFSQSRIEGKLEDPDTLKNFYQGGLVGELHTFARRGYETGQEKVPRNDYEMLEEIGLVEERKGMYFPTETMDVLLASREDILHLTPRLSAVYHPEELDYE